MATNGPGRDPDSGGGLATAWQRISVALFRPQPPKTPAEELDFSRMSDDEKRAHIIQIDPIERKVGLVASGLGIALALYANVPYMVSKRAVPTTVKPTGHTCSVGHYVASTSTCNAVYPLSHYLLFLLLSSVLALAIYVTVRIRRRAPLAFTIMMTGLAFGTLYILLPYGVAAGWIMLRAWRTQKFGSPSAKSPINGWVAPSPRAAARRTRARPGTKGTKGGTDSSRKTPEANKRYTPKSPPKQKAGQRKR